MNPLLWYAAGALGLLFFGKKVKAAPLEGGPSSTVPGYDPTKTYGETDKVSLAVPAGWRRATNTDIQASPNLITQAESLRNSTNFTSMQYGTLSPFTGSDGKTYATWVEQHYHEPGGPVKPWGLHHGVTILAAV